MTVEALQLALAIKSLKELRELVDVRLAQVITEAEQVVVIVDSMPDDQRRATAQGLQAALDYVVEAVRFLATDETALPIPPAVISPPALPSHLLN
jgi:hypothetical protein